ncbi:C10 family peptidase [bacterium]|nr:C10 family peptidase [bacterium]
MRIRYKQILRYIIPWFLICITGVVTLHGEKLPEQDIRAAVQTWVNYVTADARPDAVIESMEPFVTGGETMAYIAHLWNGGFCLCGADNIVLPVYLYSPTGEYDPDIPDYQDVLYEISSRTLTLRDFLDKGSPKVREYQSFLARRDTFWMDLTAGRIPRRLQRSMGTLAVPESMRVPLTSTWNQDSPYNDQCPELTPGEDEHTVVGCGATALAQVLYYWKWPNAGEGKDSLYYVYRYRNTWIAQTLSADPGIPVGWDTRLRWVSTGGGQLQMKGYWDNSVYGTARTLNENPGYLNALDSLWGKMYRDSTFCRVNFGAASYNWAIAKDSHGDPPDASAAEAAKISYHSGVSVGMSYGIMGSSSHSPHAAEALSSHFKYDPDAYWAELDIDSMTLEMQWLRPCTFKGECGSGSHIWVIMGYNKATDPDRQFLMNLGWGGAPAWYTCDSIDTDGDGTPEFDFWQGHAVLIAPEDVVRFVGAADTGDGSPNSPHENIEAALGDPTLPDRGTLIFKAGSINTFTPGSDLIINKELTLRGYNATIRHGGP